MVNAIEKSLFLQKEIHSSNPLINFCDLLTMDYRHRAFNPESPDAPLKWFAVQGSCDYNVNAIECEYPNAQPRGERKKDKQYFQLEFVREILEERNLTDEELSKAVKILYNNHFRIATETETGGVISFEGNKKGFPRYNLKKKCAIMDTAAQMEEEGYQCFFVTVTLDPETVCNNRLFAWENYSKWILKIFKNVIKHKGVKVLWVMESTKQGYPHIHAIVGYPKGTYRNYEKLRPNKRLKFGEIVNLLKNNPWFKVFDVKKPKDNGVKWYLTKYISKTQEEDIHALKDKKEGFTDEERKFLQGLVYSTATKSRLFGLPRVHGNEHGRGNSKQSMGSERKRNALADGIRAEIAEILRSGKNMGRLRPFLRKISTNFPCLNAKRVVQIGYNDLLRKFGAENVEKPDKKQEIADFVFKNGASLTCGGCFYVHLANLILTGDDEIANIVMRFDNGKPIRFIKPEDFENDEVFVRKVMDIIYTYVRFTCDTCGTLTRDWVDPTARERYFRELRETNFDAWATYAGELSYLRYSFAKNNF